MSRLRQLGLTEGKLWGKVWVLVAMKRPTDTGIEDSLIPLGGLMQPSKAQDQAKAPDLRPEAVQKIAGKLKEKPNTWFDLSLNDLTDMLFEPGVRGVPGDDETAELQQLFHQHVNKQRSHAWKFRVVSGVHNAIYSTNPFDDQ